MVPSVSWQRYVAIGDSSTEGMGDPDGTGGFRGWADRLAEHLAAAHGEGFEYANLAIRGKTTEQIEDEQVPATLNALKLYLPEFKKTGLKAVSVPKLLALDPPPLDEVAKGSGGCNSSWRGP